MDKKLILYGAGENGKRWMEKLGEDKIWKYADSDVRKAGTKLGGKEIVSISELNAYKNRIKIFIDVSEKYRGEVEKKLSESGMNSCLVNSPYSADIVRVGNGSRLDADSEFEGENYIGNNCLIEHSYMGYASYVGDHIKLQNVVIGKYCAVAEGVSVIRGQHPSRQFVSIHPAFYSPENKAFRHCYVSEKKYEEFRYTRSGHVIDVGNDVWIGKNVQLMEGITIGDGAVIAAGAVVTRDVEPYTIVGGVPAKWIRNRFSESDKEFLEKLQWWNKPQDWIREHAQYFSDIRKLRVCLENGKKELI